MRSKIVRFFRNVRTGDAANALFIKKSIFPNSFPRIALQLDFSRKTKYFLKLDHAIDYTRVYENREKKDENIQIGHLNK
jgi:hypothetical protein